MLAAQGADGLVASFNTWKKIPAVGGGVCSVKAGEKAVRVFAPVKVIQREVDDDTGEELIERIAMRYKLVPVFHQGQLVGGDMSKWTHGVPPAGVPNTECLAPL